MIATFAQLNSDLNNRNDVSDLLAEANIGANSKRIVCCGELTLNTPYKAGLVPGSQGIAYINMASENYGTIMYITSGGNDVFLRKKSSGTWDTNWTKLITNADLGIGLVSSGAFEDITQAGIYYVANAVTGKPDSIGGLYVVASPYNDGITQTGLFIVNNTSGGVYKVVRSSGSQNVTRIDQ